MAVRGTIDSFKSSVVSDFARPNLFQVDLSFPSEVIANATGLSDLGKFTVRAANLPSSQMGIVEVPFRGRVLKIAGDRTFEPWTITIMNDSRFALRNAFEAWVEKIQAANENITQTSGLGDESDATGYFTDMFVHQLSRDASSSEKSTILRSYKFTDVFPSNVSAIDLDFGSNDAVEEFTVELQVQYWQAIPDGVIA
tara:strand:+ start:1323 stop:1913 length:591 start_codon:yes stop_codon:yes gene_type:complete